MEFPKKKIVKVPRIENLKYDRNFQLTTYLIKTLLFVCNKQTSENRSAEAAIKIGVPRKNNKNQGKFLKNKFERVQLLVNLFPVGL